MILLTGATGYIGTQVLRALIRAGEKAAVMVRPSSGALPDLPVVPRLLTTSSLDEIRDFLRAQGVRAVIHIAASFPDGAGEQSPKLVEANILLGTRLLEAMALTECRLFLHTGTFSQQASGEHYEPKTLYDATKQAFEAILDYYVQAKDFRALTLKLFDVYGPRDPRPKLLELLSRAAASGEELAVTKGEQLVNMVHVEDVSEAYLAALRRLASTATAEDGSSRAKTHPRYFVGGPDGFLPLRDVIKLYEKLLGKPIPLGWGSRAYHPREIMTPYSGPTLPGWQPKISLEEGLAGVIQEQRFGAGVIESSSGKEPLQ